MLSISMKKQDLSEPIHYIYLHLANRRKMSSFGGWSIQKEMLSSTKRNNHFPYPSLSEGEEDWIIHSHLHVWRMAKLNILPGEMKNININFESNHTNKKLCGAVSRYFVKFRPINASHFSMMRYFLLHPYFTQLSASHWDFNVSMQKGVLKGYKVIIACSICCSHTACCRDIFRRSCKMRLERNPSVKKLTKSLMGWSEWLQLKCNEVLCLYFPMSNYQTRLWGS